MPKHQEVKTRQEIQREVCIRRNMLLSLMREPITLMELTDMTGIEYGSVFWLITELCKPDNCYVEQREKIMYKGRIRKAYQAVRFDYELKRTETEQQKAEAEQPSHIRVIRFDDSAKGQELCDKYRKTEQERTKARKTGKVFISSTFNMV